MEENKIAKILYIIGISIMVLGVIVAFALSTTQLNTYNTFFGDVHVGFSFTSFLFTLISYFVIGMIFIGFSEVIKLLHSLNHKIPGEKKISINKNEGKVTPPVKRNMDVGWTVDEAEQNKITDYFENEVVEDIIPTYLEGHCIVKLSKEPDLKIIDISGFGVKEVTDEQLKDQLIAWYQS
ncbi:hypothetical protein [Ornithinibacillus halophilus]|uniref:Uncharacterized protein n=1 Tax=Ornithinibacillus halophilus TaxID=930117 RepID=A0A1M5F3X9_9BACI|nr:hypothetical protein [Ornithinibacillus halophilus]SHF86088.1 hypothetical protein SAMN05216225_100738 [Ornithinibacillus halophilus]